MHRSSPIWKLDRNKLIQIIQSSTSTKDILQYFGLSNAGGNYKTLQQRCVEENLGQLPKGCITPKTKIAVSLASILIENSTYNRGHLKDRLIKAGLLENKCAKCGQLPEWNGERLVLILDHINGVRDDHRLFNLRLLCPNCNSQTPTFAGRKLKIIKACECGKRIRKESQKCKKCENSQRKQLRKVENRPEKQVLLNQVEKLGYRGTGRFYGVSDSTIRSWLTIAS